MSVITMSIVGIVAVLLAIGLKSIKGEYAAYLIVAAGFFIFFYGVGKLETILEAVRKIQAMIQLDHVYLETLLKMIGITYVAEFASGICKDSGYGSVGTQIEVFGKLSILAVSMPILLALMDTLQVFLS